jgi:hypothetical protein
MPMSHMGHSRRFGDVHATSALPLKPTFIARGGVSQRCQQRTSSPYSIRRRQSRQLTPFDSVYINRLQEALEMAGTNVCDMQAIPDAILNGT